MTWNIILLLHTVTKYLSYSYAQIKLVSTFIVIKRYDHSKSMRTVSHRLIENDQNEKLYLCFTIWQQLVNTVYMSQNNRASNINAA